MHFLVGPNAPNEKKHGCLVGALGFLFWGFPWKRGTIEENYPYYHNYTFGPTDASS